ncbi:reverse transcriptase [Elysia marginata]|uniref:Reverse transcriptase n=1 Tax=Elysia marginata TaxID=1093978 RepID=A0AAV4J9Y9_9GAST|nr:reverse transcriptase [Elysia marginata]
MTYLSPVGRLGQPERHLLLPRGPQQSLELTRKETTPGNSILEEAAPESSAAKTNQKRRRNQHRHQQRRARRHQHHRPEDASKLQKLYGRYPRKALRKVLGEESPYYSGGRDRLQQYVAATYHDMNVNRDNVAEARRLFDGCQWEHPDGEETLLLQSPPSADEILRRLKRTVNTSPGMDGIKWRHLKAVDRTGILLYTVLSAVHDLGIPPSLRKSRTVMIHKKSDTDDPSNFRLIKAR